MFSSSSSACPAAAAAPLDAVLGEAVGLLQQAGRAVASLDDAYNAAYNASAASDGWGGQGHDVAELGEVSGGGGGGLSRGCRVVVGSGVDVFVRHSCS